METQSNHWLPLTEYALRSGMSISTLRRKIKSNTIAYRMEEGRYLIRGDELAATSGFVSSDEPVTAPKVPSSRPAHSSAAPEVTAPKTVMAAQPTSAASPATFTSVSASATENELETLREEVRRLQEENSLRWKALEARISGIAKKLEFFSEQMAEAKMLVKIFEEKLDHRA